ncbi:hypothetical protein ACFL19_00020 [Pseudomonadota bacterium]
MVNKSGYKLKTKHQNVNQLPSSEVSLAPFNDKELDALASKIKPSNEALLLTPIRLSFFTLNQRTVRKKSKRTIQGHLYAFRKLVQYVNSLSNLEKRTEDKALFTSDFKHWLKAAGSSEGSIADTWNKLVLTMSEGCTYPGASHLKDEITLGLKNEKQLLVDTGDYPSLQLLYPKLELEADDLELLTGCKLSMLWLLNEFQIVRDRVNDNLPEELVAYYASLKNNKKSPADMSGNFAVFNLRERENSSEFVALTNVVLGLNSGFANELMFVESIGFNMFSKEYLDADRPFTNDEIIDYFKDLQTGNPVFNGRGQRGQLSHFKNQYTGVNERLFKKHPTQAFFPSLSFPVYPTVDETLAMTWLLACDRLQLTGIQQLNIEDNVLHDEVKKTIQLINVVKHRSFDSQETDKYHNDNTYRVLSNWTRLIKNADDFVTGVDGKFIPPCPRASDTRRYQRGFHKLRMSLWLMCTEGTSTNKQLKDDLKGTPQEKAVECFLALLKHHLLDVKKTCELLPSARKIASGKKGRRAKGELGQLGIGVKSIAQTRAIVDNQVISGRLVGHNRETHENVYRNRTRSSLVNGESATWAADVGNAMKCEAERLFANSEFISVADLKRTLHISDVTNIDDLEEVRSIIDAAENDGYVAELTTELKKHGKTYIMLTPWTAALIKGQIQHIDSEIQSYEITNKQKLLQVQTKQMYLSLLLERFSEKTLAEADEILEEYELPYPRMV